MRHVAPPGAVAVGQFDRVAEQVKLGGRPRLVEPFHRQLALGATRAVHGLLELVHRGLAEDGRDRPLDRLRQQREARLGVARPLQQPVEHDRLAEHRRRLGHRQGRALLQDALLLGEREVDAVAELVGESEHVTAPRGEVQHHIRVHRRDGGARERTAPFARPDGRVDPVLVEEPAGDPLHLRRERAERVEHQVAGLDPTVVLVGVGGHGRRPVVVGELRQAQDPGLEPVPALRDVVAAADRGDQRLDGFVGHLVGEVAARQPGRVAAQPVVDRLVVQQGVEDVGPGAQTWGQRRRDGLGGGAADLAVGGRQPAQRHVEGLAVHRDRRDLLGEEPPPSPRPGDRLLGEQLLLRLAEQVLPVAALHPQVVPGLVETVGGEQSLGRLVVQRGPFEAEEQQRGVDRGGALADLLQHRAARRFGRVGGEAQRRVPAGLADQLVDRRQFTDGVHQPRPVQLGDLPGIPRGERLGPRPCVRELYVDLLLAAPVEQRPKIPGDIVQRGIILRHTHHPRRLPTPARLAWEGRSGQQTPGATELP
ncbi:hypothetical protein FRACA_620009 [Frankia canadensis]|uniref:Uncharacterized protein n=1 Tax=Frankia canadensis TaxID=1836972 RepID=A0A2I2KZS9_9ACTN|nr:hypothetical protein FRACA_620009 [Frankia canadensis]SOU58450.1 hypothetical protein FRACA_620009 [Frankia canadensis]